MLIGRLSELTGVTRKTIRHYESIGLIAPPPRRGSYRIYGEEYIPIISLIKKAQSLGFTLNELREIVTHKSEQGEFPLDLACSLNDNKAQTLHNEIDRLKQQSKPLLALKSELKNCVSHCILHNERIIRLTVL